MKVLGVSGSPIENSNTDRALEMVLSATGLPVEFVKLRDCTVAPCRACLGCVETNRCVIEDDGVVLAEKAKEADALVIAGFTPYSSLDARTKAFVERLYPLRHRYGFMAGKPGGAVITCAVPGDKKRLPPAGDFGVNAIRFYMLEEGMKFCGAVKVLGNVPCVRCTRENECAMSAVKMIYGRDAAAADAGDNVFEDQPAAVEAAVALGRAIAASLRKRRPS
ncbi:MAG: flavodoxin family protein [Kiritimatiellaeota bacterium]|nr:flavodoxin family protein [Kiritimatiellota bacterium]